MATKDFSSKQIRVSQLLASGGISGTTAGMAIYSASNASNLEGGVSDGAIFNNVGSDVFLFVSGTANITNSNRSNVTLFGGDVVVSGTIYAERQVIEVDETTTGSLLVSGSLFVSRSATINQGLNVNSSLSNIETNIFNRFGSAIKISSGTFDEIVVNEDGSRTSFRVESFTKTHAVFVQGTTGQVLILSGGAPASPDELNYSDTAFFVSGSVGSKDTTTRGTSVFGGDVVISGALHGGSPLQIGEHRNDLGTDVELFVSGNNGGINVSGVSLFGGDVAFSGSIYPAGTTATLNIGSVDQSYLGVYAQEFYGDLEGAIRFNARNDEGSTIQKGQAVYIKGLQGQTATVALAACDDPSKMPAFGLAGETASDGADLQIVTFGDLSKINLNSLYVGSFTEGDVLYVSTGSNHTSGSLTNIRPKGGSNLLQNMGFVVRDGGGSDGRIKVGGAGRSNATPNLNDGHIFIGDSTNCSSTASLGLNLAYASGSGAIIGVNGQPIQLQPPSLSSDPVLAISGSVFTSGSFYHVNSTNFVDSSYSVNFNINSASIGGNDRTRFNVRFAKAGNPASSDTFFAIQSGSASSNTQFVGIGDSLGTDVYTSVGGPDFLAGNDTRIWYGIYNDAQRSAIYLMSGAIGTAAESNPRDMTDINFYVSGTVGGKGTEGTSVFGGDVFVSGSLYSDQEVQAYSNIRLSDTEGSTTPTVYMNTAGSVYLQENNNSLFIEANNTMDITIDNTFRVNGDSETNPIFVISNDTAYSDIKGTLVNFSQDSDQDFSVSTANQKRAIFVSASDDSVMIHAEGLPPVGGDTAFFVSGSAYDASAGSFDPNNFGEASGKISQFSGDIIVSGAIVGKNDSLSGISGETNNLFLAAENSIYGTATSFGFYGDVANLQNVGSDMFYFVSGTIGGKGTEGVAVFGGDVVVSGSLIAEEQVRGKETYTLGPFYRQLNNTTEGIVNYSSNTLDTASPNGDFWQHQHQWVAPCSGTLRAVSCMTYGTPGSAINPTPSKVIFAMRKNIFFGGAYPDPTTHFSASMRDNSGISLGAISNGISAVFNAVDGGSTPATDPDYEAIGQAISGSAPFSFAPGDVIFLSVKPETAQAGWYITCNFILELETQKIK